VILLKRIKHAIKVLFSKDIVLNLAMDEAFKLFRKSDLSFFVQIGSNDGRKNDPLYFHIIREGWKGILVEPDPINFIKLKETYKTQPGLIFENIGLSSESGNFLFYKIASVTPDEPQWYDQIGSFDQATFLKNISYETGLLKRIEAILLPVVTFDELLARHAIEKVDLLKVDAEGFDYRILCSIDFKKYSLRVIIFEGEWMTQFELREIIERIRSFHYQLYCCGGDYIAIRR
jgi:FkbM family methyltransferase